jgi:hypothetical protein
MDCDEPIWRWMKKGSPFNGQMANCCIGGCCSLWPLITNAYQAFRVQNMKSFWIASYESDKWLIFIQSSILLFYSSTSLGFFFVWGVRTL